MSPKADPSGSAFFYVFVGAIHESPAIVKLKRSVEACFFEER